MKRNKELPCENAFKSPERMDPEKLNPILTKIHQGYSNKDRRGELGIQRRTAEEYVLKGCDFIRYNHNKELGLYCFEKAIEIDPKYEKAYIMLGTLLVSLYLFERAERAFDKAIEIDPENALSYLSRSSALMHTGKVKKGIQDMNRSIELDPKLDTSLYLAIFCSVRTSKPRF